MINQYGQYEPDSPRNRSTLTMKKSGEKRFDSGEKPKRKPGGARLQTHDKDLKRLEESEAKITLYLITGNTDDPNTITGRIVGSDKFTIKLDMGDFYRTVYKHAIESILEYKKAG
jgi:RNA chaperone Hfq